LAASVDENYQKNSPLSPQFDANRLKKTLVIDDDSAAAVHKPQTLTGGQDEASEDFPSHSIVAADNSREKDGPWYARWSLKGTKQRALSGKASFVNFQLHPGAAWWFKKEQLSQMLAEFTDWNKRLEHLVGPLMSGFGFYDNEALQNRLQPDGPENIFKGLLELNKLSDTSTLDGGAEKTTIRPWDEAFQSRIPTEENNDPCGIYPEYKELGIVIPQAKAKPPIRELYGHQMARLLVAAGDGHFNTLRLNSYAYNADRAQYVFLFDHPNGASPQLRPLSLHNLISSRGGDGAPEHKLELKQRFRVAQMLVRSIGALHAVGWLHKSIRSHAIKFFFSDAPSSETGGEGRETPRCNLDQPYLTDFGFARPAGGPTRLNAPSVGDVEYDIYRHPERYDPPVSSFTQMHDIYSVGVVLLEIGLWETARELHDWVIRDDFQGKVPKQGVSATQIQDCFIAEARDRLGHRMGSSYRDAVLFCLSGEIDDFIGKRDFANEFQKRVVEKVDISLK